MIALVPPTNGDEAKAKVEVEPEKVAPALDGETAENVEILDMTTRHDIPVERIYRWAKSMDFRGVVILGYTKSGDEYFSSSIADGGEALWLLERAKQKLLKPRDGEDIG